MLFFTTSYKKKHLGTIPFANIRFGFISGRILSAETKKALYSQSLFLIIIEFTN